MATASPSIPPTLAPTEATSVLTRRSSDRLSMSFEQRLTLSTISGFLCGLILGSSHGGKLAGLRFRAENAHRLPTSSTGWYLYHKSKNYYRMRGGLREGVRKGTMLAAWVGVFIVCEESADVFRATLRAGRSVGNLDGLGEVGEEDMGRSRDFVSTVCAGLGTSGLWSLWNKFPLPTAARTAKMGLVVGLGYGLTQDVLTLLKGQRVGYVDWVRGLATNYRMWKDKRNEQLEEKTEQYRNRKNP